MLEPLEMQTDAQRQLLDGHLRAAMIEWEICRNNRNTPVSWRAAWPYTCHTASRSQDALSAVDRCNLLAFDISTSCLGICAQAVGQQHRVVVLHHKMTHHVTEDGRRTWSILGTNPGDAISAILRPAVVSLNSTMQVMIAL